MKEKANFIRLESLFYGSCTPTLLLYLWWDRLKEFGFSKDTVPSRSEILESLFRQSLTAQTQFWSLTLTKVLYIMVDIFVSNLSNVRHKACALALIVIWSQLLTLPAQTITGSKGCTEFHPHEVLNGQDLNEAVRCLIKYWSQCGTFVIHSYSLSAA